MITARWQDRIPEILVALSYFPCGSYVAYILHSYKIATPEYNDVNSDSYPLQSMCFAILGAFLTALTLTCSKWRAQCFTWWHNYIVVLWCSLLLVGGLRLYIEGTASLASSYLNGFGYGCVYISGLSYIHVRVATYIHRVTSVALCHLLMILGMGTSVFFVTGRWSSYHEVFGIILVFSSAVALVELFLIEILSMIGFLNYKMSLDRDLQAEDQRRDRLKSAIPEAEEKYRIKRLRLTLVAILTKLVNGVFLNSIFLRITFYRQEQVDLTDVDFIPYCIIIGGMAATFIATFTFAQQPKKLLGWAGIIQLLISCLMLTNYSLWVFYIIILFAGAQQFLPDLAVMDVSNPNIFELNLFWGFLVQKAPVILSIVLVRKDEFWPYGEKAGYFLEYTYLLVLVLFLIPTAYLHRPPKITFDQKILDIQNEILDSYYVWHEPIRNPVIVTPPQYPSIPTAPPTHDDIPNYPKQSAFNPAWSQSPPPAHPSAPERVPGRSAPVLPPPAPVPETQLPTGPININLNFGSNCVNFFN